jgi:hypothetical protein
MIVICAWCQENQGEKEPLDNTAITHGLCLKCCEAMLKENAVSLPPAMDAEFFDALYDDIRSENDICKNGLTDQIPAV